MSAGSIERDIGLNMAMNPFVPQCTIFLSPENIRKP